MLRHSIPPPPSRFYTNLSGRVVSLILAQRVMSNASPYLNVLSAAYDGLRKFGKVLRHTKAALIILSLFFALFQLNRETKSSRLAYGRVIRLGQQEKKWSSDPTGWLGACRLGQQAH
jgi:hypothetical protein